ncbi:hypothetical protein MKW92_019152 [Papaver armeniacum]|nr:hypothetical protein MKW92_019152 [Papaver armeniacum]
MTQGAVHDIRKLQVLSRNLTSNLTFQEAYDMTGRVLGPPRCLNYLTSPNVVIWSVETASCAFPDFFEAQEMMAKDISGDIVPYHPPFHLGPDEASNLPVRRWRDGINHVIVSQDNPHIAPFLRLKEIARAYGGNFAAKLAAHVAEMEVKHRCHQLLELGFPLGGLAKLFNPSHVELQKAANQGMRCTWEKLSAIKVTAGLSLHWTNVRCLIWTRTRAGGRSTGKNFRVHRINHDGSDSDSESIDLNSWTRCGGPLMRTASANKFVDYVQNLDGDSQNYTNHLGLGGRMRSKE